MSEQASFRLGILGGTFDPIHKGHLRLAYGAMEQLNLAEVLFIPAWIPPHKVVQPRASFAERLAMVELAIAREVRFQSSDLEYVRQGTSYTYDTLGYLQAQYPTAALYFITGADANDQFVTWHRWQEIFDRAHLVIASRPGYSLTPNEILVEEAAKHAGQLIYLTIDAFDISATMIRQVLASGDWAGAYLPAPVADYIVTYGLYGGGQA